jgi:hypothetical protein
MKQSQWLNIITILFIIFILLPLIFNLFGFKIIEGAELSIQDNIGENTINGQVVQGNIGENNINGQVVQGNIGENNINGQVVQGNIGEKSQISMTYNTPMYKTLDDISNNAIIVNRPNFPRDKILIPIENINYITKINIPEWWPTDIPYPGNGHMQHINGTRRINDTIIIEFYLDIYGNANTLIPARVINNVPNLYNMNYSEMYNNVDNKLSEILKKIN